MRRIIRLREAIMPITRKWSINDVLEAVRSIPLRAKERITFEYVLLGGVNDRREHADEVAALIRRANIPAKVNLIVWNPGPGVDFHMPLAEDVARFQSRLMLGGIPGIHPSSSGAGYLCCLRTTEADTKRGRLKSPRLASPPQRAKSRLAGDPVANLGHPAHR